jgi:hypothetical protein
MTRLLATSVALVLTVAACGGDSGDAAPDSAGNEAAPTQVATTQADTNDDGSDTTSPAEDAGDHGSDSEGSGPSTATATVGDQTYTFSTEGATVAQCKTNLYGVFSAQLPMVGGGGSIQVVILLEGTDPVEVDQVNAVSVSAGDEDWVADESNEFADPGMSQVDSVEIDGRTVSGTATFVRQNSLFADQVDTVTGTFEATCGEERLS